ncbi:FtsK/SpoIIIE domain-containing protein [Microbacterium jiangjiandongii]|uniref:FtsK/SpoIIIE domain-containing protein n=1 Tax=Microbacterium jiangjiandongii TaxID=3049071 RepID=UPI00214C0E7B|nr:FtsK/SpoIIIE domain-containing protein [Microbacterium sp. zg.Y843]MCR2816980.1 FtsK/SpoIIIE domain-containing protein [Microbacterium sp. zg.Y843]
MKIRVTLRRPDGSTEDIALAAEPGVRVGEVADSIVARDPQGAYRGPGYAPGTVTLEARASAVGGASEALDPDDTLADLALASGVEVGVVGLDDAPRADVAYIEIVGGHFAGRRYTVPRGSTVIGRGDDCGVVLDDAMVSKRHARLHVGRDRIELIDLNSANGIIVQGAPVGRLEMQHGQDVVLGSTVIRAGFLPSETTQASPIGEVRLTRSPSVEPRYIGRELEGAEPPTPADPQPFPWAAAILPAFAGIAMFAFTRSPLALVFVAISPLMMISTWATAKSQQRRKKRMEHERFVAQIERLSARLAHEREEESRIRAREAVPLHEIYDAVQECAPLVWTRRPEHWSFLQVRLGVGDVPTRNTVKETGNTDRALPEQVEQLEKLIATYELVPRTPVVEKLSDAGALGIAGDPAAVAAYGRALAAQVAGLHAPSDVVIGGLLGPAWAAQFADAKWLPHAMQSDAVFGGAPFADTASAAANLLSRLEETLSARSPRGEDGPLQLGAIDDKRAALTAGATVGADSRSENGFDGPLPAIVVLISDDAPVDRARLIQVLERAAGRGVYPIWMATDTAALPAACRTFVELGPDGSAAVGYVRLGRTLTPVEVEGLTAPQFAQFCRRLASYVDAGEIGADTSDVPRSVPMLQLIGKEMATAPGAVVDRWEQNGSILSAATRAPATPKLRAIVGQAGSGAMHLDLRAQGPHALVGGTTGSGKSEFLQAWVLGMAAEYSPQRVTFLFVDYKGGAAFAECTALPHCVGLVTDLSPHLVRRALVSLRAELHHRETLFTRKKAKDILELEKRGDPDTPPALVIVIDEFAALVNEVPDFVDGVVDVAQRGRSLGIHLIMATQRPAGVIKDNLRANTNMRVALRMADEVDSDDVIGTKDAAGFDPAIPGRGAAKTGPGRLTVFQSAYTGGWSFVEEEAPEVALESFAFGPPRRWEAPKTDSASAERDLGPTDQQRLVATMVQASQAAAIEPPRRPWLDELATVYDLTLLRQRSDQKLLLGVQDVPQRQAQDTVYFEPDDEGHLAIFGTGGAGKSATLRTLAVAAGITPRGGPVHVYGLDFGSGGLRMLEAMPHVGAVIPADAGERVTRLFRMLKAELDRRGEAYAAVNAGTISQYRSLAGRPDEARILVLIDGFPTFRSEYEAVTGRADAYQVFQQIMTDGRSVGIHVALTADRGQAVPTALQSTIQKRVVLRLSDSDAYPMVGAPRDVLSAESAPGRAIVDGLETQIAVIGGTTDPRAQAQAIGEFADAMRRRGRTEAPAVRALPETYGMDDLPAQLDGRPVLGLSGDTLGPIAFEPNGLFVVAGAPQSGRSNALHAMAEAVRRANPAVRRYYIGSARSPLRDAVAWDDSAVDGSSASRLIDGILQDERGLEGVAVFLEGAAEYSTSIAEMPLSDFAKRVKRGDGLLVAEGETSDWTTGFGLLGDIKSARRGVVLQPDTHDGEVVLKTAFPRLLKREFPVGRAMLAVGGKTVRVQFPLVGEASSADGESSPLAGAVTVP